MTIPSGDVRFYAADSVDYLIALGAAEAANISTSQVVGDFYSVWELLTTGSYLVIAVGGPANNALYYNECGWPNPAGDGAGVTPFTYVTGGVTSLPGANVYENAAGTTRTETMELAMAYAFKALNGSFPSEFPSPPAPIAPSASCSGASDQGCPVARYWGVDTAAPADSSFLACIDQHYGSPYFWGRYLTTVSGVSTGLTSTEITFLHNQGIKIMPIYNGFGGSATGYTNGVNAANAAITAGHNLAMPKGKVILADIESQYPVDAPWLEGWADTIAGSTYGYKPGYYFNPYTGSSQFDEAFATAINANSNVQQALLWSSEPEPGVSGPSGAPTWGPTAPTTNANVLAWQYGEGSTVCGTTLPVDTDLILNGFLPYLW